MMATTTTTTTTADTTSTLMVDGQPVNVGDKLMCFSQDKYYNAVVLKIRSSSDDNNNNNPGDLFIHYNGWKSHWDEWVTLDRVMRNTPENVAALKAKPKQQQRGTEAASSSVNPKRTKTIQASTTTPQPIEDSFAEAAFAIPMSDELNAIVLNDYENVAQKHMRLVLPRKPSVSDILKEYVSHAPQPKRQGSSKQADLTAQVAQGVQLYFNRMLFTNLLYKRERQEFSRGGVGDESRHAEMFGIEHLLRLLIRLPRVLTSAGITEQEITAMTTQLGDLTKFLETHRSRFVKDAVYENEIISSSTVLPSDGVGSDVGSVTSHADIGVMDNNNKVDVTTTTTTTMATETASTTTHTMESTTMDVISDVGRNEDVGEKSPVTGTLFEQDVGTSVDD